MLDVCGSPPMFLWVRAEVASLLLMGVNSVRVENTDVSL